MFWKKRKEEDPKIEENKLQKQLESILAVNGVHLNKLCLAPTTLHSKDKNPDIIVYKEVKIIDNKIMVSVETSINASLNITSLWEYNELVAIYGHHFIQHQRLAFTALKEALFRHEHKIEHI